jgi:DNA ligase (NAD+)
MYSGLWSVFFCGWLRPLRSFWLMMGLLFGVVPVAWPGELPPVKTAAGAIAPERIHFLRTELARHDELYFKKAAPEISDADYDRLKRELREWEQANPDAARDPTVVAPALGDDRTGLFPTYRHRERMLSLSKSYSESELRDFDARLMRQLGHGDLEYMVEPKFDGLAISVTYEKGRLVRAVTRGDGAEGDDVTANTLTIKTLPRELAEKSSDGSSNPLPDVIELRGEVYLSYAEFGRINREREEVGEDVFSHPRNLAAGTLKLLDPQEVAQRRLEIVFYGWGACTPVSAQPQSQSALLAQLRAWDLPTIVAPRLVRGAEAMWQAVQELGRERKALPFPIDGVVVKLNAVSARLQLGANEQAPNWAMAYKFKAEQAVTRLRGITIQVGRTGVLTPVAELEPVELGGSTITRATLHNRDEIARRDIRTGDYVQVEKAGEIIPQIAGVVLARRPAEAVRYVFPENCPACRSLVVSEAGEAAVRCPNGNCPAQVRRRIESFVSKACVDISGLGPATIDGLVDRGLVQSVADLYRLTRADLLGVEGVGEKTADKLLVEIQRSRQVDLWRFINGLSIPHVGKAAAKALAIRFGDLAALMKCSRAELLSGSNAGGRGLGVATAESVLTFFAREENRLLVTTLLDRGVRPTVQNTVVRVRKSLAGKIFVLTGTLPALTRAEASQRIEAAGGKVADSVTSKTDYLVVGTEAGMKLAAARKLAVPEIDEAELLRLLGAE